MHCIIIITISKKLILVNYLGWWILVGVYTVICVALFASLVARG